jgi:hypothetical protein
VRAPLLCRVIGLYRTDETGDYHHVQRCCLSDGHAGPHRMRWEREPKNQGALF